MQNYIDLHCHTIASKKSDGESNKRNVRSKEQFLCCLKKSHVSVVAITNHNHFDCIQYQDFKNNEDVVVLPGIELDIELLKGNTGHLIFVSNPETDKYDSFLNFISLIKANDIAEACNIKIKLQNFGNLIKDLDGLIIVHYGGKASSFSNEDVKFLKNNCSQNLFVEPSSLISAFIYLNKGMQSIIGSDVTDWDNYPGKELPELKVPIEDFSRLKLLLKKDKTIIKQKTNTKIYDSQFKIVDELLNINEEVPIFKDCNVIMGPKSSGKSIFLKAIKSELISKGLEPNIRYYSAEEVPTLYKKLSSYVPSDNELNLIAGTDSLFANEIYAMKNYASPKFSNIFEQISEFIKFSLHTKLAKQLGFVSCGTAFSDDTFAYNKEIDKLKSDFVEINNFRENEKYKSYLTIEKTRDINLYLKECIDNLLDKYKQKYIVHQSLILSNKCILDFKSIFTQLKSTAAMPNTTGLKELYEKESVFIKNTEELHKVINIKNNVKKEYVGVLDGKGRVYFAKEISSILSYSRTKNPITLFKTGFSSDARDMNNTLETVFRDKFDDKLAIRINKIKNLLNENNILSIKDFLGYQSYFIRENGSKFTPSKGEQAVLVLSTSINDNSSTAEFYLLDEPEMSVGHHYVNATIVPRIKELCTLNKCVIVCTHDANIGVGTLPFQVIYREEDNDGIYHTYLGNPFSDVLTDQFDNKIKWRDTAVKVLEGGREALDLREVTYGDRD